MTDLDGAGNCRRRSVDVGGLALALGNQGLGHGWGGWEEREKGEVRYAELLSEMYTQTQSTVNHHRIQLPPIEIPVITRHRLIESLDSWNFEPHKLPDEEVFCCTLILFETLFRVEGMQDDIGVSLSQISEFLRHLRTIYRWENSYHNFQHALDVLQATQTFLFAAGKVPPVSILLASDELSWRPDRTTDSDTLISCLDNLDLFTLYIAAIGHDVGHPGFTNVFMKNVKAPLSVVYDDKSALEQMHYALLLQIMRHNGLGDILDRQCSGARVRKLLSAVVLATDMSVHFEFMKNFASLLEGDSSSKVQRVTLLCQALIKCADISNPSRPHGVSQHWASALSEEWTSQVQLEKHFHLPATVKPSTSPLSEAKSQIFFINNFAKPLLDLTARAIPQLERFAQQCTRNLQTWEARSSELLAASPTISLETSDRPTSPSRLPEDFSSAFPMTLPAHLTMPGEQIDAFLAWHPVDISSSSSDDSSEHSHPHSEIHTINSHTSPLPSPLRSPSPILSPCESVGSCLLSPRSENSISFAYCRPSNVRSSTITGASNAIRAAYHASVRKKKSLNRNSWNMSPLELALPPPSPSLPQSHFVSGSDQHGKDSNTSTAPMSIISTFTIMPTIHSTSSTTSIPSEIL